MNEITEITEITEMTEKPGWLDKEKNIVEPEFCKAFLLRYPMKCILGRFCTVDGIVPDEAVIKRDICDAIQP